MDIIPDELLTEFISCFYYMGVYPYVPARRS